MMSRVLLSLAVALACSLSAVAQSPTYTRTEDVIYGRKHGLAMTMDVFAPKEMPNGAGVVFCVSGGWFSSKESVRPVFYEEFLKRGYVVFAVVHGSQPKFTIPEVLDDMHRAVRFIRHNATKHGVDPERLAISGASAGGHLSLMQGVGGKDGDPKAKDPVDRESSKVAVVGCFFPPTDFLNYGKPGEIAVGNGTLAAFRAPFDFREPNPKVAGSQDTVADETKRNAIARSVSPVYLVTPKSAPALIIHGDADQLVPIYQAELFIEALKKAEVPCELVVKKGAAHGWQGLDKDIVTIADWFDKHVLQK